MNLLYQDRSEQSNVEGPYHKLKQVNYGENPDQSSSSRCGMPGIIYTEKNHRDSYFTLSTLSPQSSYYTLPGDIHDSEANGYRKESWEVRRFPVRISSPRHRGQYQNLVSFPELGLQSIQKGNIATIDHQANVGQRLVAVALAKTRRQFPAPFFYHDS